MTNLNEHISALAVGQNNWINVYYERRMAEELDKTEQSHTLT